MGGDFVLGINSIKQYGSEEQKKRWLPSAIKGDTLIAFALTEPEKGSESINPLTTAEKVKGGYILNGKKRWIGSGALAD